MRASVIICTIGRSRELSRALDSLRLQHHRDFEVIVVQGPGVAVDLPPQARSERCAYANVSRTRNTGIAAAAGEVVAFLDDDAVAEPTWLSDLLGAYEDSGVAGAGGLVFDASGWRVQYRAAVCDRRGRTRHDQRPPLVRESRPGADPFLYLQGTNMSFRRDALVTVGGFDEAIAYVFDDVEMCATLIDAGHRLVALDGAPVHHYQAPSAVRDSAGELSDPLPVVRGRAYFAVRHRGERSVEEVLAAVAGEAEGLRLAIHCAHPEGGNGSTGRDALSARIERGIAEGSAQALAQPRSGAGLPPPPVDAFRAYLPPRSRPPQRVCVIEDAAAARALAVAGDDVHLLRSGDDSPRVELHDGVWHHELGPGTEARRRAARYHEVLRLDRLGSVELVVEEGEPAPTPLGRWCDRAVAGLSGELLEGSAFPLDFVSAVQRVWALPPGRFLSAVYGLALGRDSDAPGRARWMTALERDDARLAVVIGILASEEARARDVPPAWAQRLTEQVFAGTPGRIREAWLAGDEAFVRSAYTAILQRRADSTGQARWIEHLRAGGSRFDVIDGLCAAHEARAVGTPVRLADDVRGEVFDALAGLVAARREDGDEDFLTVLHRALLGRAPDGDWTDAWRDALAAGFTLADVVREVTRSPEARSRGLPAEAVAGLLAAVAGQAEEPGGPGSSLPESAAGGAGDMAPNPDRSAST